MDKDDKIFSWFVCGIVLGFGGILACNHSNSVTSAATLFILSGISFVIFFIVIFNEENTHVPRQRILREDLSLIDTIREINDIQRQIDIFNERTQKIKAIPIENKEAIHPPETELKLSHSRLKEIE